MRVLLTTFSFAASCLLAPLHAIDFARDIRPILSDKCFSCHGPDEKHRKADLRLDQKEEAFLDRDGVAAFVAGDLQKSESWLRIISEDEDDLMPPPKAKKPLTPQEKQLIRKWIESGAEWTEHWSFTLPAKPAVPPANDSKIAELHPIDSFVHAALKREGKSLSPLTDKRTLIRRITFDLTGLPPTLEEIEAFVKDTSPQAYEKVVDRLLASPHFGERMALFWLDAARYGDTSVMHADGPRDMWPWRDWVVKSFNENRPYDQFSIEQLAGDLLPDPTNEQLVATGFNRNHPSSDEGGAISEELRVGYVADRVKTTANVWLGLSMECAQCHDHKYDPISHKEYFQFFAYFNNTTDPGMQTRKGNQAPIVEVVTEVEEDKLEAIEKKIETQKAKSLTEKKKGLSAPVPAGEKEPASDLAARLKHLKHYFPLDESAGNVLQDAVGRKDAAGEKGLQTTQEAKFGQGLVTDGSRVYDATTFTDFTHKSKFTLAAWVKIDNANAGGAVFSKMHSQKQYRGFDLWMEKGKPGVHLVHTWPANSVKVFATQGLKVGQWHHVAATYDGTGNPEGVKVYIDGAAVETQSVGGKKLTGTMKTDAPFRIGGRFGSSGFKGQVDEIHIYDRNLKPEEITWTQQDLVSEANITLAAKRTPQQRSILEVSRLSQAKPYLNAQAALLRSEREKVEILEGKTTSMVMADNPPEKMRKTYILDRGQYDAPIEDEVISPGTPAILPPLPQDAPNNRLGLARWLFAEEHPLTARVAANQLWLLFFGNGIVRTPADLGAQGEFPTHPELLDWLAVDFRENGWDIKQMIRQIVLSQTYQQRSDVQPELLEKDPENRLLARAPRFRLQAEMIRDNALALSGQLNKDAGGPGVKPYQPPGLWAEVGLGGNPKFVQDKGEKLYRRTLYTYWKRSAPHPAMVIFDAPNRETCVIQRPSTNTPLQALAAMNDVQMMEASRHLAERILREGGATDTARISWAFELATARIPEPSEIHTLLDVYRYGLEEFSAEKERANALLAIGESPRDETLPPDQQAAWTVVASLLLNLDEVLTRN